MVEKLQNQLTSRDVELRSKESELRRQQDRLDEERRKLETEREITLAKLKEDQIRLQVQMNGNAKTRCWVFAIFVPLEAPCLFLTFLDHSGPLWTTLDHSGPLWTTLDHSGTPFTTLLYQTILDHFEQITTIQEYSEPL